MWATFKQLFADLIEVFEFSTIENVIFGSPDFSQILNHLLILGKQYSYHGKMQNCLPLVTNFRQIVNQTRRIEEMIEKYKNKMHVHNFKRAKQNKIYDD